MAERVRRQPSVEKANGFKPEFRFLMRGTAEMEIRAKAQLMGSDPRIFVVVGPDKHGKFAICPTHLAHHYGAQKVERKFENGSRVYDMTIVKRQGTVKKAGAEVCEVQWDHLDGVRNVPNYYIDVVKPKRVRRVERVRRTG